MDREERQTVYIMLGLRMEALTNESLKVRGVFGEETLVLGKRKNVQTFLPRSKPPSSKTFGFALILRESAPPETSFRPLGGT